MTKDKKVADFTCILPTMLCIAKKSPQEHIRAQGSAHTVGFQPIRTELGDDVLKGNLMNTGDSY